MADWTWSDEALSLLAESIKTGKHVVKIVRLNREDLLRSIPVQPEEVMNHRAVAGTKKARQLNRIVGKHTTAHPNDQGDRQIARGKKYYMVPGTNGHMIVQTRSRREMDLPL